MADMPIPTIPSTPGVDPSATAAPAAPGGRVANPFDQFDNLPASQGPANPFDAFDKPDPGAMSDFAHGLKAGGVDVPKMAAESGEYIGHALHAVGLASIGDAIQQKAQQWAQDVGSVQDNASMQQSAYGQAGGLIRRNMYAIGRGVGQLGTAAAGGAAVGAGIGALGAGVGAAPGAVTGALWSVAVALPTLFAGSTAEQTTEAVSKAAKDAGASDEDANTKGVEYGAATGAVAGAGAAVLNKIGLGSIVKPYTEAIAGAAQGELVSAVLNTTLKGAAKAVGVAGAEGAAVNAAQQDVIQGIDAAGGAGDGPTVQGTVDAAVQGGIIAGVMRTGSEIGHAAKVSATVQLLADQSANPAQRQKAAIGASLVLATRDPQLAQDFAYYADNQINKGLPVEVGPDAMYQGFAQSMRQDAELDAAAATRTTAGTFIPNGDEAAQVAPDSLYDPNAPDNSQGGLPSWATAQPKQTPAQANATDIGNNGQPSWLNAAANPTLNPDFRAPEPAAPAEPVPAPPTLTDTIGTILHAGSVDDAIAAAEQSIGGSAARAVDAINRSGVEAGAVTPEGAEATPSAENLAADKAYFEGQRDAAASDMRGQAFDQAQQVEAAQAPATPADPFAQRAAEQAAQDQAARDAAHTQMQQDQLAQHADTATDVSNATEAAAPAAAPSPMSRAMQVGVDRLTDRFTSGKQLSTIELGQLAQHATDPEVQKAAANQLELRKNKDIVLPAADAATGARASETTAPTDNVTTLDAQGNMRNGEAPVQFSPQRAPVDERVAPVQQAVDKGDPAAPAQVEHVDPSTLPDTRTAANNGIEGSTTLSKGEAGLLQKAAAIFGKKVVLYRQKGGMWADGMVLKSDPKTIYVNADAASAHHLVVFGHELAHQMRTDAPKLFDAMRKSVLREAGKGAQSEFMRYYMNKDMTPEQVAEAMKDKPTADRMTEEFVADLVGNRFSEYRTWQNLFANAGKENRGMVYRVADFVTKFIDHLMNNVGFRKFATDDMVKNLAAVRQTVRRALSDYSAGQSDKAMAHEAEQLRASMANRAEATTPRKLVEPVDQNRAFVGKAPSKAAPAPVDERPISNAQGSPNFEPHSNKKLYGEAPVKAPSQDSAKPSEPPKMSAAATLDEAKTQRQQRLQEIKDEIAKDAQDREVARTQSAKAGVDTRYKIDPTKDSLFVAAAKMGGVSKSEMSAATGRSPQEFNRAHGIMRAVTAKGHPIDDMASALHDMGYLTSDNPHNELVDKLDAAADGQDHFTPEGEKNRADAAQQQEYADQLLRAKPEESQRLVDEENVDEKPYTTAEEEQAADHVDRADYDESGLPEFREGDDSDIPGFDDEPARESLVREDQAPAEERAAGPDAHSDAEESGRSREEDFGLTGESQAEGEARLNDEEQARQELVRNALESERREQADAERDDFDLRGSDRPADDPDQDALFSPLRGMSQKLFEKTIKAEHLGKLNAAQEQAAKNVGAITEKQSVADSLKAIKQDLGKKLVQGIADQFYPIKQLDQAAYMHARLSKGYTGTFEAMMLYGKPVLRDGVPDVDVKDNGFIHILQQLKGEHGRFFLWMAAKRAEELKAEGRENLFTDQDISALKTLDRDDGSWSDRSATFAKVQKEYEGFNDSVLNIAKESGLIDDATYQKMKDNTFVPFYRVMDDGGGMKGPGSGDALINQRAWKTLKGGTNKLNQDLLANVMNNWAHLLGASARNRAAQMTLEAAAKPGIGAAEKVSYHDAGKNAVRVMVDGKAQFYEVTDKHLMQAVSAMSASVPSWMKPLSFFKRMLTTGTTLSPVFRVNNMIRDTLSTLATSDVSRNAAKNLVQGWKSMAHDSQTHASMLASGGIINFGTMLEGNEATRVNKLVAMGVDKATILDSPSKVNAFWKQLQKGAEWYHEVGNKVENANRGALYEQLRAKGVSHAEASFQARDIMDFSLQGSNNVVRFLTTAVPFLNARIQGAYKLGRGAAENPKRAAMVMGAVAMGSLALMLANQDDPDWKKRPDWDRDNYWWFKVGQTAYRIPKPFEVGAVGTIVERTWEKLFDPEMTTSRYVGELKSVLMSQFELNPVPQAVRPLLNVYANRDDFTGNQIETEAMQGQQAEDRYGPNTTLGARLLGQLGLPEPAAFLQGRYQKLSPVQMEYLVRGYMGWAGMTALQVADAIGRPMSANGPKPAMTLRQMTGGFAEDLPANTSRYLDTLYENSERINQAYTSWRTALRTGQVDKAQDIMNRAQALSPTNRTLVQMHGMATTIANAESRLALQAQRVADSPNLSAETKRTMLNRIDEQRNQLARNAQLTELARERGE